MAAEQHDLLDDVAEMLARVTTRELYGIALAIGEEAAARAQNYIALIDEPGTPPEVLDEGAAMADRFCRLYNAGGTAGDRQSRLQLDLWKAARSLNAVWDG